jgi:PAS domain S-box-containing protein
MNWIFRELVENSDDIFIVVDKDFRIRYISSMTREYGSEPYALLGRDIFEFVCPEKVEECRKNLEGATDRKTYEIGLKLKKDTITYFDITIFRLYPGEEMHGHVLKLHDITSKKVKEKELISSNKQLDQVIYKTTHDLRAPLMSALALVSLAENAPTEQKDQYYGLIKKSLMKLNGFIDEMVHFFRTDKMSVQCEKIDLRQLLNEELEHHQGQNSASKIAVELEVQDDVVFWSDEIRIKTIMTNLITNSVKYADLRKEKSFVRISAKVTNAVCEFRVEDNGIGIEEEHQDKVFDLFFRATTQSHGTGLGLFIVKDTVERLGGSLAMTSQSNQGTTFTIRIPNQLYSMADLG